MKTKRPDDSLMNVLADSKRQVQILEKYNKEQHWVKSITRVIKIYLEVGACIESLLELERVNTSNAGITEELDWLNILAQAMRRVYGDPLTMQDKQHSTPWWNPTTHRINVKPMGLWAGQTDSKGDRVQVEFIDPGEVVLMPIAYTQGGKQSVVKGVAPQLRELNHGLDEDLDLKPQTFSEWCYFIGGAELSKCCGKPTVWSTASNGVMCPKCRKPI